MYFGLGFKGCKCFEIEPFHWYIGNLNANYRALGRDFFIVTPFIFAKSEKIGDLYYYKSAVSSGSKIGTFVSFLNRHFCPPLKSADVSHPKTLHIQTCKSRVFSSFPFPIYNERSHIFCSLYK